MKRRLLLALAAGIAVLALAGPGLGRDPLGPGELSGHDPDARRTGGPGHHARLPSLLAVCAAAVLITLGADDRHRLAVAIAAGTSPALVALGRDGGPGAVAALLVAASGVLLTGRRRWMLAPGVALLGLAVWIAAPAPPLDGAAARLGVAAGAWGVIAGPAIPPWRLDLAVPMWLLALPLLALGVGRHPLARLAGAIAPLVAGGLIGLRQATPAASAMAAGALAPLIIVLAARGLALLPDRYPRWPIAVAVTGIGAIGSANVHLRVDLLDPARRVEWHEAAAMLAALAGAETAVVGLPDFPAVLAYHEHELPRPLDPNLPPAAQRILVVSWGLVGGLERASAPYEERLSVAGYRLRGEFEMGALEPGLVGTLERLGVETTAPAYLRVRRWERPED